MKKTLLLIGSFFCLSITSNAQAIYTEPFTGTTLPTGWSAGPSFTLATSNILNIVMTDSVGPQQPSGPAANWDAFQYVFTSPVDMTVGCKCISFYVDNTDNEILVLAVQAQDINHAPPGANMYTDQTNVVVEAGFVGIKTVNFAGKFENYYGWPSPGGKIDSTQVEQINIQALGETLTAAPWSKKFLGDFKIDNFTVGALAVASKKDAQSKIASSNIYPNPVSDMATVAMELNAVSDVKVTLSDMMGKEMMTITEGNMSSVNANINVANLNKGIYSVNYTINGAAAKSELLMVK